MSIWNKSGSQWHRWDPHLHAPGTQLADGFGGSWVVALESMLLKDASEPIVKNIGERMAFLIRDTLDARKLIVANVNETYQLRSAFIHHGESVEDLATVERFLGYAWETFRRLLERIGRHDTRALLIQELDDRKLS